MYSVTKIFRVPIGHRLSKHKGLCQNIHGHNFKIEVKVSCHHLDRNDMVIDFSDLKRIVNKILEEFDHSLMLNSNDVYPAVFKTVYLQEEGADPTAERLAQHLYEEISERVKKITKLSVGVDRKRVWENDDSYAEYTKEYDAEEED
jgi:6-pyruvoyltetrahydropterin/6-carboxytetrahydropterin synthase